MDLDALQAHKKPVLRYEKIEVRDPSLLRKLVFPISVLAPIGTFNEHYEEELKQAEEKAESDEGQKKKKKPQAHVINSERLQEQLNNRILTFHVYHPTKKDIVEEYGAKYIDVADKYYGFGLYSFIITTGTKIRKQNGDRRRFEINEDIPTLKETIYVYYDEEAEVPCFKRISAKGFKEKMQEATAIKFSEEATVLIQEYKEFFNSTFLSVHFDAHIGQSSDQIWNFYSFAMKLLSNIEKMKKYYLYYNIIGALNETEFIFISKQIDELEQYAHALYTYIDACYKDRLDLEMRDISALDSQFTERYIKLHAHYKKMKQRFWWFNVYTGEFHRNVMSFFYSYATTSDYEDNHIEQLQKEATQLELIALKYMDIASIEHNERNNRNSLPEDGWHYGALSTAQKPDELKAKIHANKDHIKKVLSNSFVLNKYPKYRRFLPLVEETDED